MLALIACGLIEVALRRGTKLGDVRPALVARAAAPTVAAGGLAALAWVAFKVGALSYGGGFVIIPLMQHDAVHAYHWMTDAQFLNAVALGQVTPGPVVLTVATVGYAAAGVGGGLLAAAIAFAPSFLFVLIGGPRFSQLRANRSVQAFLAGAGPAAIGAIAGSTIPLALALGHWWQVPILVAALGALLLWRRGVVVTILGAAIVGLVVALAGAPRLSAVRGSPQAALTHGGEGGHMPKYMFEASYSAEAAKGLQKAGAASRVKVGERDVRQRGRRAGFVPLRVRGRRRIRDLRPPRRRGRGRGVVRGQHGRHRRDQDGQADDRRGGRLGPQAQGQLQAAGQLAAT